MKSATIFFVLIALFTSSSAQNSFDSPSNSRQALIDSVRARLQRLDADTNKIRRLNGLLTNLEWMNKHEKLKDSIKQQQRIKAEKLLNEQISNRNLGIRFGLGGAMFGIGFVALAFYQQNRKKHAMNKALTIEKKKSDDLLLNILPSEVAEELKVSGNSEARQFEEVTVLFTDFVNFTTTAQLLSPKELVQELHHCFKAFDEITGKYHIEKIKTIGDAYLAVAGLPIADSKHAINVVLAALEIREFISARKQELGNRTFDIRIGIHSGPVVAGIVGVKKFAYDIWGDTVNTAARMEQNSEPGGINISEATYRLIKDEFEFSYRGEISAKNKGALRMYFVNRVK
jgi:adenylate cyclase